MKGSTLAEVIILIGLAIIVYASFLVSAILALFVSGFLIVGYGIMIFIIYMKESKEKGGG